MPEHKEGNKMSGLRTAYRHIETMLMDPTNHYFGALTKNGLLRRHTYKKGTEDVTIGIIGTPQTSSGES
jgi:hypothetical protein